MTEHITRSDGYNCPDDAVWQQYFDYRNCNSCKAVVGATCNRCGAFNNSLAIPYFTENNTTLCEECDSKRQQQKNEIVDEDIENILRTDLDWKELNSQMTNQERCKQCSHIHRNPNGHQWRYANSRICNCHATEISSLSIMNMVKEVSPKR